MLSLACGAARDLQPAPVGFEQPWGQRFGLVVAQLSLGASPKGLLWVGDSKCCKAAFYCQAKRNKSQRYESGTSTSVGTGRAQSPLRGEQDQGGSAGCWLWCFPKLLPAAGIAVLVWQLLQTRGFDLPAPKASRKAPSGGSVMLPGQKRLQHRAFLSHSVFMYI